MEQFNQTTFEEIFSIKSDSYEGIALADLDFSIRTSNSLGRSGIRMLTDLLKCSPHSLMNTPGFGKKCLEEITNYIQKLASNTIQTASSIYELKKLIPIKRLKNKVHGYIKAYSANELIQGNLISFCSSEQSTLEEYINEAPSSDDANYNLIQKFLKWCSFDLLSEVSELVNSIYPNDRIRTIIKLRAEKKTLEYIGSTMALTRERVRQIEDKAKSRFAIKYKDIQILSKIVAEKNGDTVVTKEDIKCFCGEYAEELMYFLQSYQAVNFTYDKKMNIFVVDPVSMDNKIKAHIETMPDSFNSLKLSEFIKTGYEKADLPEDILKKAGDFKMERKYTKTDNKKEYEKNKFKYQNVCFRIEEMEVIDSFCKENNIARNTLIRKAVMEYIGCDFL